MRTIRTKVYFFNELNEEAQQKAIENDKNNREIDLFMFNEDAITRIQEAGFFDNIKLQYSLGYSQGDGLSFSCNNIESKVLLKFFSEVLGEGKEKTAKIIMENCEFEYKGNKRNYCYASIADIDYYTNSHCPNVDKIITKICEKLENLYMQLCKDLEKSGYAEIENQYSDEYIKNELIGQEIEFTKNGNIFNS